MEKERIALLTEVKKKNNEAVIKKKMHLTFSYRRQELVEDLPMISDLQSRWPVHGTFNFFRHNNKYQIIISFYYCAIYDIV